MKIKLQLIKSKLTLIFTLISFTIFSQWTQFGGNIEGPLNFSERFGSSVSFSDDGSIMAIGAPRDGVIFTNTSGFPESDKRGIVRIYEKENNEWVESYTISGNNGEQFGTSLSLSSDGKTLVVGAPGDCLQQSDIYNGLARVYSQDENKDWIQIGADIISPESNDCFGESISISGDGMTISVGAFYIGNGSAYVYKNRNSSWEETFNFDGSEEGENFGSAIDLSKDGITLAIGAYGNNDNQGTARVYRENSDESWSQIGIDIDGETLGEKSGFSISLSSDGSILAIGAYGYDATDGIVRIYNINEVSITKTAQINGISGSGEEFGCSVDLSNDGTVIAIGAQAYNTPDYFGYVGAARIYTFETNEWSQSGSDFIGVVESFGIGFTFGGRTLALSGEATNFAFSTDGYNSNQGLVQTYEFTDSDGTLSLNENTIENLSYTVVDNRIKVNNDSVGINAIYNIIGQSVANSNLNGLYIVIFENNSTGKQQAKKLFIN